MTPSLRLLFPQYDLFPSNFVRENNVDQGPLVPPQAAVKSVRGPEGGQPLRD